MSTTDDDDPDDKLDELATRRGRGELERVFAEQGIPGKLEGDLFVFGFADLVARFEILNNSNPTSVHAHMTVSSPKLALPILDCWVASGKDKAEAVKDAIEQWAQGPYLAYHNALAHDQKPSYVIERDGCTYHVFEAPMQWFFHGPAQAEGDALTKLGVTRSLVERVRLGAGSEQRAHRLRWIHGLNGVGEVFLDDEPRDELKESLDGFPWPDKLLMVRHSAVLLPAKLSQQRTAQNYSLGEAYDLLTKASGVVDVDSLRLLRGSLQHGIEREPCDERIPLLCQRWTQLLAPELRESNLGEPHDAPMSRGLMEAHAKMLDGDYFGAAEWLDASLSRATGLEERSLKHMLSLAKHFCESGLPPRNDSVINAARAAMEKSDGLVRCASSSIEAPSAIASLRDMWPNLGISFGDAGRPDPRRPRGPNALSLWTYKSDRFWDRARDLVTGVGSLMTEARPAVAPPTTRTTDAIARIAETQYSRTAWLEPCQKLARDVSGLDELLGAMVHPPPRPSSQQPWDWRFHVQVAAAFAIGHLVIGDVSAPSAHPLVRLLDGPVDWSTTAALIALCDVALRRPTLTPGIVGELHSRLDTPLTPVWYQCYLEPARWAVLRLSEQ